MIKKKNGFLTFVFSLIPGAGEMYLGFMKEGISIMAVAFALCAFAVSNVFWEMGTLVVFFPLIWFYSFFNVHNKASLSDEEFYALEDDYLFHLDKLIPDGNLSARQTKIFGWVLVLLGVMIVWGEAIRNLLNILRVYISADFADIVGNILYKMPWYVVAGVLIVCGVRLIGNKKKELDDEFPEGK